MVGCSEEREAEHRDKLTAFAQETTRRADRLGDASDRLTALATRSIQKMIDQGEDLEARLLASLLNAAAALASVALDVHATALGVEELLAHFEEDLEPGSS